MADMLSDGASWLATKLQSSASETVTYYRPTTGESLTLKVTYGRQLLSVTDRAGHVRVERADKDFVFPKANFTLARNEPQAGDRITLPNGDVYEVTPVGVNEPAWRYSDAFEYLIRIHTKRFS